MNADIGIRILIKMDKYVEINLRDGETMEIFRVKLSPENACIIRYFSLLNTVI